MDSEPSQRGSNFSNRLAIWLQWRWRGMTLAGIIVAVFVGVALGQAAYTFRYAEGLWYLDFRSQSVHQLPHHAVAVRWLAKGKSSQRCQVHRLPLAA